jgi:hypothetical protein
LYQDQGECGSGGSGCSLGRGFIGGTALPLDSHRMRGLGGGAGGGGGQEWPQREQTRSPVVALVSKRIECPTIAHQPSGPPGEPSLRTLLNDWHGLWHTCHARWWSSPSAGFPTPTSLDRPSPGFLIIHQLRAGARRGSEVVDAAHGSSTSYRLDSLRTSQDTSAFAGGTKICKRFYHPSSNARWC